MLKKYSRLLTDQKTTYYTLIVICLLLFALFAIIASLTNIIADDFEYFSKASIENPLFFTQDFWHHSGRLTQGFFVSLAYSLFGEYSVKIIPFFYMAMLSTATSVLFYQLLPSQDRKIKSIILGALFTCCIMLLVPSTFDSFFWLTSSSIYANSIIYVVSFIALCIIIILRSSNSSRKKLIVSSISIGLAIFVLQMISEPASLFVGGLSGLLLLYSLYKKKWQQLTYFTTALIASILGFLMIYFSPGSTSRRANYTKEFDISTVLGGALQDYVGLFQTFVSWKVLIIVLFSASAILFFKRIRKTYDTLSVAGIGLFMMFVPPICVFILTNYSIGYTAMRAFSIPTLCIFIGLTLLVWAAYSYINRFGWLKNVSFIRIVILLIAPLLVFSAFYVHSRTIQAESLRDSMLDFRADYIAQQKSDGADVIILPPAPLLLETTESIDVGFNHKEGERGTWLVKGLKHYYNIADFDVEIRNVMQPAGYCMPYTPHNRFGEQTAQSCKELSQYDYSQNYTHIP